MLIAANGSFSYLLTGYPLISNKKYYYRAVANNSLNMSYGDQTSFTLLSLGAIPDYNFNKNFDNLTNASLDPTNMSSVASSIYTDIIGTVFWGFLFAIIFIMIWMRQEDITIPSLLDLIIGASLWSFMPPEWVQMAMSLTVISFAGLVYSLLQGRK